MIITRLFGGLGNQMFQYAAGLALAEQYRSPLKLDVSAFAKLAHTEAHNRYALHCLNVVEQFATANEVRTFTDSRFNLFGRGCLRAAEALGMRSLAGRIDNLKHSQINRSVAGGWGRRALFSATTRWHIPPVLSFYPAFRTLGPAAYLDGLFQSERFFTSVADLLRLHFTYRFPALPAVAEVAARISSEGPSAAVHFRRGDYVSNKTYQQTLGPVGPNYYQRAVARLREQHPDAVLYIFSDDIDAVEREFRPGGRHHFIRAVKPWHAYDKIRLMSLCDHQIIANSTFSWWAAWLNPSPVKTVIAPTPWFSDGSLDGNDLVPPAWQRLER